jgi:methylated-DNA-[protein]-cysteine S-methyltransferase
MFQPFPDRRAVVAMATELPDHDEAMRSALRYPEHTLIGGFAVPSVHGNFAVAASAHGVSMVFFPGYDDEEIEERMRRCGILGWSDSGKRRSLEAGIELMGYLVGQVKKFETPVDVSFCSPFAQAVYRALTGVPFGETVTYGELAKLAGHPGAARAVGSVLRANPCPIFVPCHRVLSASGGLGGWSGPEGWKQELLRIEGVLPRPDAGAG